MTGFRFAGGRVAWVVRGAVAVAALWLPAGASAAVAGVFAGHTMDDRAIPCVTQTDGVRVCTGDESGPGSADLRFRSFDGTARPLPLPEADGRAPVARHGRIRRPNRRR